MFEGDRKKWNIKHFVKNLKAADRPRKKEKVPQPPGTTGRKLGVLAHWGIILLVLLLSLAAIGATSQSAPEEIEVIENPATEPEAAEFAKVFADTYFTWNANAEGWERRASRLEPMLAAGLDEQAGLITNGQEWNSTMARAEVYRIEEVSDDRAAITLRVVQELTSGDEQKVVNHWFTVPVGFAEAYGIYDLPSFTAVETSTALQTQPQEGTAVSPTIEDNVRNFLGTFFESYAADTPDTLGYFFEDPETAVGLEGKLEFEEIPQASITQAADGTLEVRASVLWIDPETETGYTANYRMTLRETDGRYIVVTINEGEN